MKNAVIGNRNQKEKFVQSQIVPKYVFFVYVCNFVVKKVSFKIIFTLLWFMKVILNGELHYKLILIA